MSIVKTQRVRVWSKAGKLAKKETIKHRSDQEYEKNCIVSERKGIRHKTCLCFDTPFFQSFNINFKVRSQKNGHFCLFCFWKLIFCSHESKRCWTVHRDQRINCDTVALRAKQSGTVKTVEHSKNDYHKCSKQALKDWHSGDFEVKWKEKELLKYRQNCFKAFG